MPLPAKHILSKSTFIRGVQCPKSLYLHKKRPFLRDKLSAAQLAKFRRGTDVGVLARDLFPGGIDMTPASPAQYQKKVVETQQALENNNINTIYEAVFQYDDVLIMLDILQRDGAHWKAFEVKSSRAISETYLTDAALQYYVLQGAGIQLSDFSLIIINKDYVLGEKLELNKLFLAESVIEQCRERVEAISETVGELKAVLLLNNSPKIQVGSHCNRPYPCDFIGHCWKNIPAANIFRLTAFETATLDQLALKTIYSANDIPDSLVDNDLQKKQVDVLRSNTACFDQSVLPEAIKRLNKQNIAFVKAIFHRPAVPLLQGTRPYQALPLAINALKHNNEEIRLESNGKPTQEFINAFANLLIELAKDDQVLITDDASELVEFMQISASSKTKAPTNQLIACHTKVLGISQLLQQSQYFHPAFGNNYSIQNLSEHLLTTQRQLKDETWIIKDLLNPDLQKNEHERLTKNIANYTLNIRELSTYFSYL